MAETIASFGVQVVVIQRGVQGQYLYNATQRERWVVPAYPVQRVDLNGAGDAFCGGFLAGLCTSYDPLTAVLQGNVSASLGVEGTGAFFALDCMPGLPQSRLDSLRQMARKV
jgi:sugar/nucleoside kinase (ribokinase family)